MIDCGEREGCSQKLTNIVPVSNIIEFYAHNTSHRQIVLTLVMAE